MYRSLSLKNVSFPQKAVQVHETIGLQPDLGDKSLSDPKKKKPFSPTGEMDHRREHGRNGSDWWIWSPNLSNPRWPWRIRRFGFGFPWKTANHSDSQQKKKYIPGKCWWNYGQGWIWHYLGITLPETNSLPLKIGRAPKGNSSSKHYHQFSGAFAVSFTTIGSMGLFISTFNVKIN